MKLILIGLFTGVFFTANSQSTRTVAGKTSARRTSATTTNTSGVSSATTTPVTPRQTITEKYLNGGNRRGTTTNTQNTNTSGSPFGVGIHPAQNATIQTFDQVQLNNPNAVDTRTRTNATIPGGNDTTFNVNSINQGGVTTNSGAVDRSGQSQFGQTNWGNSRSTIGESQWTIPPPITASFNRDFPSVSNATWVRNNVDTSIYSARYKSGPNWIITNYSNAGQRLDTKTEIALLQPPRPVSVYLAKQPAGFEVQSIYFLQMQGRPDMYEITTRGGKTIYLNNDGMEVRQ